MSQIELQQTIILKSFPLYVSKKHEEGIETEQVHLYDSKTSSSVTRTISASLLSKLSIRLVVESFYIMTGALFTIADDDQVPLQALLTHVRFGQGDVIHESLIQNMWLRLERQYFEKRGLNGQ